MIKWFKVTKPSYQPIKVLVINERVASTTSLLLSIGDSWSDERVLLEKMGWVVTELSETD